jgi:energy-coupling factor transporter ATP-binding protein EcfA2
MTTDARLRAFLHCPLDVFESIEHRHEIWREDPFDVPSVHAAARDEFERLLARVTTPMSSGAGSASPYGRILLLLGDSGSGKTHLLRALRAVVHKSRAGFVGYMPLTSDFSDYRRYLLSNLIDSLDQPYDDPIDVRTGLARLAQALASVAFEPGLASFLRDDPNMEDDDVSDLVHTGADRVIQQPGFDRVDIDLIAALLYLHRPDTRLKARVIKYLRCEELTERDRKLLGGLASKSRVEDAERMVEMLGRIMGAAAETPMSLVVCLDQLEGVFDKDTAVGPVQRALTAVSDLADLVPSSIFVVSCLREFYENVRRDLPRSLLERIQKHLPLTLDDSRSRDEAREMIKARLQHLYAFAGADFDPLAPLYPFPPRFVEQQPLWRTREIVDACRRYRDRCQRAGGLLPFDGDELPTNPPDPRKKELIGEWERRWNDFFAERQSAPPEDDDALAEILAWALRAAGEELETGHRFPTRLLTGAVHVESTWQGRTFEPSYVALCNRTEKFGWLGKQILQHAQQAQADARKPTLVLARNDAMPPSPSVAKALSSALREGGRTVVIQDSDWRTMHTLRRFCEEHRKADGFEDWLADENHLSRLPSIRNILDLDRLDRFGPAAPTPVVEAPLAARTTKPPETTSGGSVKEPVAGLLTAGISKSLVPQRVDVQTADLTRHAAFLGMTGSGKTTLALGLLEQLLLQGIPVLMIDRKGDLAGYARPETWSRPIADVALAARQKALAEKVDVALFTPGHPEGRPIAIGVAPDGLAEMSPFEREEAAARAAQAIADMLGYKTTGRDASLRAILVQALKLLAEALDRSITLDELVKVVGDVDPMLVARVGRIDTKLFGQLAQSLETLKLTSTHLFGADAERLDVDALLGKGAFARPGRTRLCIVSTKFLNGDAQTQFWVAQLLMAVLRWTNKNPRAELQAALLFDEADLYLPATRQPATKAPMESLLKRGRSAGLSVQLATQSPGDLDYRCRDNIRTWFIGRVKEPRALEKLRPLLSAGSADLTDRLATQAAGEFHMVQEGPPTPFSAAFSVLRTDQLPDSELLALARRGRPGAG